MSENTIELICCGFAVLTLITLGLMWAKSDRDRAKYIKSLFNHG